jgi:lipopolysaccharide transport system ATP-binding protein
MKPILEIKNLSKKYRLGHENVPYLSLRDSFSSFWKKKEWASEEDFWALKDVSFEVYPGESLGIIGKNGAGKSTLLKILSSITPPSSGKVIVRGRVASLLEVGTGFHGELSGRENVMLNGSILGMKRKEILSKFDEIVDFSGVDKFLDTPLKHYSSGMKLRLAFAVAAFLEPEILLLDEVLAVGDAEFQKKCLWKMEDLSKNQGRTVLFVSHSMGALMGMTNKAILLSEGAIAFEGNTQDAINFYLGKELVSAGEINFTPEPQLSASVEKISIVNNLGRLSNQLRLNKGYSIGVKVSVHESIKHFIVGLIFVSLEDKALRHVWSKPQDIEAGKYEFIFKENTVHLVSGKYKITFLLYSREVPFQLIRDKVVIEFIEEHNKDIALFTNAGVILNQMEVEVVNLLS